MGFKNLFLLVALAVIFSTPANAEGPAYNLDEIVVTATAGTNYQVQEKVSPDRYEYSAHVQETVPGLKSPYIGPFTGNQVAQALNGIRSSNALYRSGPNQYYSWVPDSFVKSVSISDGGNVGGTISRELCVQPTHVGTEYISEVKGFSETASFKDKRFGFALSNIGYGNVHTAKGTIPHSSYNQRAFMTEADWDKHNRTIFLYSQSHDLDRTDKWNGGFRSSGYQEPSIYTWELQKYLFLNHKLTLHDWDLNFGYQKSEEKFLDGKKHVHTKLDAYTVDADYSLNENWSSYSTNTIEKIIYDNGVTGPQQISNDRYATTKQGLRYSGNLGPIGTSASAGMKEVNVTGFDAFNNLEASLILVYKGLFASIDRSTNAPGYASLKQSATSGKGTSIPNPDLTEEYATTFRLGYKTDGVYFDVYRKHFSDAFTSLTIAKNTYKPINYGHLNVTGATAGYQTQSISNTGIGLDTRIELAEGNQSVYGAADGPISKTPLATCYLNLDYRGAFVDWKYAPKDKRLALSDLDDVRIFSHNHGYSVFTVGYSGAYQKINYKLALNNIFNNDGRVLGSSVDVPERGIVASATYRF
jgi:hypothetical protein